MSVTLKPVARITASTSGARRRRRRPGPAVASGDAGVTSSTLGGWSAGYQPFEGRMRLQPIRYEGSSLSRSSGSWTWLRRWAAADPLHPAQPSGIADSPGTTTRAAVGAAAPRLLRERDSLVESRSPAGYLAVAVGHHPGRRCAGTRSTCSTCLDLRHELDRRGAGADHRDPLARQVDLVIPAGGVEERALELVEPGDVGDLRLGQRAVGGDQHRGAQPTPGRLDPPALPLLVPLGIQDLAAEPQVGVRPPSRAQRRR